MTGQQAINNRRIAKNTLLLYCRMIVVMGIGLYTVRAILDLLGVVDYGIYNVVGSFVMMFSFLSGTLATSSQRYFSVELAKGDQNKLNKWFCLNITVFSAFILLFVVVAETVGLWFVNTQLTIPADRLPAANWVYQLSILAFCTNFYSTPYNALIIARERMSAFAYISIVDASLKLGVVFLLTIINYDKLIVYGLLTFLTSIGITSSYIIYNLKHFEESHFHWYWNKAEFFELIGFSGWHFFGTFSVAVRSQGINILLNIFFSPAVNAARAVAYQVFHAINQLSANFFMAVKPQLYKTYAKGDMEEHYKLVLRSSVMCVFLVSILVLPIIANTSYILGLWLKQIPEYTIVFTQLVLINGLIDSTAGPTIASALATGNIRKFYIIIATLATLNLPISFIVLLFGAPPQITMLVSICISFITVPIRAYLLKDLTGMPFSTYTRMFFRLTITTLILLAGTYFLSYDRYYTLSSVALNSLIIIIVTTILYLSICMNAEDRALVFNFIKSKC